MIAYSMSRPLPHAGKAADQGVPAKQFVDDCKKKNILIMGIGHRIKSKTNPDMRVELVKKFALDYLAPTTLQ